MLRARIQFQMPHPVLAQAVFREHAIDCRVYQAARISLALFASCPLPQMTRVTAVPEVPFLLFLLASQHNRVRVNNHYENWSHEVRCKIEPMFAQ